MPESRLSLLTRGDFRPRHFVTLASSAPGSARDLTYDQIGNPLNYRDGFSFKWSGGRKLTSVKLDNGSVYMTGEYRYDDNGIRTYKEINGNVTKYYLNGSTILTEETNYGGTTTRRVDYVYDENGSVYGFSVGGKQYYYQKNLQGDVIGILDKSGNLLVSYVYTAYGVPTTSYPGVANATTEAAKQEIYILGSNNPFRYRSYYFDTETGFYYLNSRYYDPVTGRFLNADGYCSTGQGVLAQNMFAYCANNPVNRADPSGEIATIIVVGVLALFTIVGAVIGATSKTSYVDNMREAEEEKQKSQQRELNKNVNKNDSDPQQTVITKPTLEIEPPKPKLTVGDRIVNTLIGAGMGLATGGLVLVGWAAGAAVFAGGTVFGMAASQVYAIGALAFNVFPMVIAPFFSIAAEPLE